MSTSACAVNALKTFSPARCSSQDNEKSHARILDVEIRHFSIYFMLYSKYLYNIKYFMLTE